MTTVNIAFSNPNDTIPYTTDRPEADYTLAGLDLQFVQLTYDSLRVGPHGDDVAWYDQERGQWRLSGALPSDGQWHDIRERLSEAGYSDVTISFG